MPRFYFDVEGPACNRRDDEGCECSGVSDARQHAVETVCAAVREHHGDEDWFSYTVRVRDLTNALVCAATLTENQSGLSPQPSSEAAG